MKQTFLTITFFSILVILPSASFAQTSENLNALADRMVQEFKEDKFDEGIETANKLLKRDLTPESKKFIYTKRSVFLFKAKRYAGPLVEENALLGGRKAS